MIRTILVCLLIILLIIITYNIIHTEAFSHSTNGAIQQLQAKDVQDINISVGVDGYPPVYDPLYGYQPMWNAPTRFPSYLYSYPYYYYYPGIYNYYGYAYSPYWSQWRRWWRW
jgi:hypothetical protein